MDEMPISEIRLGRRHRQEIGDLEALMDSIEELGLLHPVVVTSDGVLVAGMRRIEACKRLCRETVPVRVLDTDRLVQAEHDENELRKDFTPSERVAIGRALEPKEKEAAKERMVDAHASPGRFPEQDRGNAEDKTADAVGWSRPTYRKAKEVVEAAEEDPDAYGDLQQEMDETGKVHPAHRKLTELRRQKETEQEKPDSEQTAPQAADAQDTGGPPERPQGLVYVEEGRAVDEVLSELNRLRDRLERIGRKYGLGAATVERVEAGLAAFTTILKQYGSET
jgi:ParB-like chromosome segregation protein Spo0J